ncbi:hypothetical protein ABZP36_013324 [Zizania latifolia]
MGVNVSGSTNTSAPAPAAAGNGSTATMCSTPCFGQMTMMMDCLNGVLVNIQGYSPGLVQGVQAVFQMACGRGGAAAGAGASSGAGSSSVSSNSVAMSSLPSPSSGGRLALAVAVCFLLPCCFASKAAMEIFEKVCHCFDDHNVYNECKEELRLGVEGAFHVGKASVDEYCEGPCLAETKMALQCVEEVADEGFRFYSGASVPAVRAALSTGCSYTPDRGTFEIRERRECGDEYYSYHHRHEQEQPAAAGYGEEGGQQQQGYPGGGAAAWGDYCYGAGGPSRAGLCLSMLQQMLLLVPAALLPLVI